MIQLILLLPLIPQIPWIHLTYRWVGGWGLGVGVLGCWEGDTFGIHIYGYQEEMNVGAEIEKQSMFSTTLELPK